MRHPVLRLSFGSGNFKEPGFPARELDGSANRHRTPGRSGCRVRHGTGAVRPACWRHCTTRSASRWLCWLTSTTSPFSTHWRNQRSPGLTATTCAACTQRSKITTHTSRLLPHRGEQVLQGQLVLRPQQSHRHHLGPALLGHLRLYRGGFGRGVRAGTVPAWTATPSALGTTATTGWATNRCTTRLMSYYCFVAAPLPPTGLRRVRRHSCSIRCWRVGSVPSPGRHAQQRGVVIHF